MQANRQATFSFLFFLGSLLISVIVVPGVLEVSGSTPKREKQAKDESRVSQNFNKYLVRFINKDMISKHLEASYQYLLMSAFFDRSKVSLPGFSKYFRKLSDKEFENANFFMSYITKRGGSVELRTVDAPPRTHWIDGIDAMYDALEIQKKLNDKLIHLHTQADKYEDPHVTFTVEDHFLDQKVREIKEIGGHITNLERMMGGYYGLGEYIFDRDL